MEDGDGVDLLDRRHSKKAHEEGGGGGGVPGACEDQPTGVIKPVAYGLQPDPLCSTDFQTPKEDTVS